MAHGSPQHTSAPDLHFHACLLALSHSGRHERTTYCMMLGAGPIEGSSAAIAVRRYYGFRTLVCAFVVFRRRNAGSKTKASLFVFLTGRTASRNGTASFHCLQEENLPSSHLHLAIGTPQYHDLDWEECMCRELATLTQTHTHALPAACCCYAVVAVLR